MNTLGHREDPWDLLKEAVNYGRSADMAAWAAAGLPGIELLFDVVTNATKHDFESPNPRIALLENLPRAFGAIAGAHPDAFLDVFSDIGLDDNPLVVAGLGKIASDVATDRLIAAAKSTSRSVRVSVAHGLARRNSPKAIQTLAELRDDEDSSVRYNAILAGALAQVPIGEQPMGEERIRLLVQSALEARIEPLPKRRPRFSFRRRS